ncbi:MAG: protein-L-isoaspartate(D-aspartate) O-methyltransferase [Rhodospirillales bacterium]|jgi:protein-L-isoaspartate(D-aspartate) O-methyltransferase|nr:protein-L-isoaspartate(D-aspartate) O-methyltransferase [Rhodospirillales bacterium]
MRPVTGRIRLVLGLRKGGITDTRVLAAMEQVPREVFVPETFRDRAYDATALPIGHHQTVSEPLVVARMTQALEVGERHKVLEIGTGSGYQSMVLARLCRRLYTIERHPELLRDAEARFAHLRLTNITSQVGDGTLGWPGQAPFDRIMVTAAAAAVPETLVGQLTVGGVMVVPVGAPDGDQTLMRVRLGEDGIETEDLMDVYFVPLISEGESG